MDDIVRIKEFTKRIGITQEELAKRLGVSNNTVTNWAKGKRFPPRKTELALLHMGMTIEELFNEPFPSTVASLNQQTSLWEILQSDVLNLAKDLNRFKQQGDK